MGLNLIIPLHSLLIDWRYSTGATSLLSITPRSIMLLMNRRGHRRCSSISLICISRIRWHAVGAAIRGLYDHVCDTPGLCVLGQVVIVIFGEFGDDVPGVQQTGNVAEHAEAEID